MGETLVIIPTYDERDNIRSIVERTIAATDADVHVLIVDDASPDGTGRVADEIAATQPRVQVLHRAAKQGLGPAYLAGFQRALASSCTRVVEMDADGSHLPEDLPRLLTALSEHDLAVGSRWVSGGRVENWPLHRVVLSRFGSWYARTLLGLPVLDATGGFRAFRVEGLRRLRLDEVASQGYCFQIDLLARATAAGLSIAEVPIVFVERTRGASKMSHRIVIEASARVTSWGLQRVVRRAGLRMPASAPIGRARSAGSGSPFAEQRPS